MPLTPADVHNVAFSKPPIGKRGYNEDEVDQFLDLVEDTLAELEDEKEELRSQLESGASAAPAAEATGAAAAASATDPEELERATAAA
ncbi:MAG: DivIVA domain-containing protein, partial [Corynebacterium variabile]|nr:DivIVA domain-containing protein [Corynebacterium variabile]